MADDIRKVVEIPFCGFYYSTISEAVDSEIERDLEARSEEDEDFDTDEWEDNINYSALYKRLAKDYLEEFNKLINESFPVGIKLEWESMTSPKEYNFSTDRIFAYIDMADICKLALLTSKEKLAESIQQRFTDRPGFISYYSNDIDDWLAKDLTEWDHNELGTLLIAAIESCGMQVREIESQAEEKVIEYMSGNGVIWEYENYGENQDG